MLVHAQLRMNLGCDLRYPYSTAGPFIWTSVSASAPRPRTHTHTFTLAYTHIHVYTHPYKHRYDTLLCTRTLIYTRPLPHSHLCSEAFGMLIPPQMVAVSYMVAISYVLVDTLDKVGCVLDCLATHTIRIYQVSQGFTRCAISIAKCPPDIRPSIKQRKEKSFLEEQQGPCCTHSLFCISTARFVFTSGAQTYAHTSTQTYAHTNTHAFTFYLHTHTQFSRARTGARDTLSLAASAVGVTVDEATSVAFANAEPSDPPHLTHAEKAAALAAKNDGISSASAGEI